MTDKPESTEILQVSESVLPRKQRIFLKLRERVKELTALHRASRLFQKSPGKLKATLARLVKILPAAWQYPPITSGRILYGSYSCATGNFKVTPWVQSAEFATRNGKMSSIEIAYLEEKPMGKVHGFSCETPGDDLTEKFSFVLKHNRGIDKWIH